MKPAAFQLQGIIQHTLLNDEVKNTCVISFFEAADVSPTKNELNTPDGQMLDHTIELLTVCLWLPTLSLLLL